MTGVALHDVFVYSHGKSLPRLVKNVIHGALTTHHITDIVMWPDECDFYAYTGRLTAEVERAAGSMRALPVHLEAAQEYFSRAILTIADHRNVYIFHAHRAGERK